LNFMQHLSEELVQICFEHMLQFGWDVLIQCGWIVVNGIFFLPGWQGNWCFADNTVHIGDQRPCGLMWFYESTVLLHLVSICKKVRAAPLAWRFDWLQGQCILALSNDL
jgi:hypothetical protein